jgi:hypothetical protein
MANLDHMRLAHALAKTFVQPGVSDETVEQCIYQIGLVLATNEPGFDLRHWRRLIAKQQASLQRLNGETSVTKARLANRNGRKATTRRT